MAELAQKEVKPKTCKCCKSKFHPARPMQNVCGPMCGMEVARKKREKETKAAQLQDRKETRAKLEKLKKRGEWLAEAKVAIQKFRRLDELSMGSGCMSCGRTQEEVQGTDGWKPGGAWDGGHYMSKGARPELALEPLNIWLQCKSCNGGSGKYARKGYTVNASFRKNLIERIGIHQVEWLEGPHDPKHYTVEDLKAIKADYTARAREIERRMA